MNARPRSRAPLHHPRVWWSRLKIRWPFLIWLGAAAGAFYLYQLGATALQVRGIAESVREDVAPLEAARLLSIEVVVGQVVTSGQVLARCDTTLVDAEVAVEQLQIERQFNSAVFGAESQLRDARLRQAEAEIRAQSLQADVGRLEQLVNTGVREAAEFALYRADQRAAETAAAQYPPMIREIEADVARSRAQLETMRGLLAGKELATDTVEGQITAPFNLLKARRESLTLRTRQGGLVSQIWSAPGAAVQPDLPVVTVVGPPTGRIVGYLPEWDIHAVARGALAYVAKANSQGPGSRYPAHVVELGPDVVDLPLSVSPTPRVVVRGRHLILQLDADAPFLPGEAVTILIGRPPGFTTMEKYLPEWLRRFLQGTDSTRAP